MKKLLKPKTCKICSKQFNPISSLAKACSPACAVQYAKKVRADKQAKADKIRLEEMKALPQLTKECQQVFNKFIRLRDWGQPCISCGTPHTGAANSFDAGHYRSVGSSPELRFEPLNVHKQCAPCNNHKSGNVVEYRISLVKSIGLEKVEWLEGPHEPKRYTINDVKALKAQFRAELRAMQSVN